MSGLDTVSVNTLKGVGVAMAEKLAKLHIHSIQDLLFHLPLRYQDRSRIATIGSLRFGDEATIIADVISCEVIMGKRRSLVCRIKDDTGSMVLRFFHFSAAQKKQLEAQGRIRCFGEVRRGSFGFEIFHPEYKLVTTNEPFVDDASLTPIYPLTEGITQAKIRDYCEQAIGLLNPYNLQEWLPTEIQETFNLAPLFDAITYLHKPPNDANQALLTTGKHPAQVRLAFEELLAHQLSILGKKIQAQQESAPVIPTSGTLLKHLLQSLPYQATGAQHKVFREVMQDLSSGHPMLRLIQGDVGSGKTLVAAMVASEVIVCGLQVAVMAPTEILAEQHFQNFQEWFSPLGIEVAWLVGKIKGKTREQELAKIAEGKALIVIGTHALFQESVSFHNLALAIIDEQHRFGVHQRMALRDKGVSLSGHPHQLIMTATPIPRTLAMSAYADLDCSIIDELPPGRTPVNTIVVSDQRREEVTQRVSESCRQGMQAYWVCTLIEESEALQCSAAEDTARLLAETLPDLSIGLVHGRLKPQEKALIMEQFKVGLIQLLVATTVIEVGVNVPNANLMVIENPERLGLAQLHQLRGRVGRGSDASHCVLLYQSPLSQHGKARLNILRETSDGFKIAEKDLEIRGPGELLGVRQTGLLEFRVADLQRDQALLEQVQQAAILLHQQFPDHITPIIDRWLPIQSRYLSV